MFKQKIENGYQVETPDNWLKEGNPFELRREEYAKEVRSEEMYILTKIRRQEKISLYRKIMNPYLQSHMICRSWDTVIT